MRIGPREGVLLRTNLGRAIVTNGDFTASVCDSASTVKLRFGVVRAVGRGIAVLDGVHIVQGEGKVLGGFVLHFHNGKCRWIADGGVSDSYAKLHNISVRQTYHWKARFVGFLAVYSLSRSKLVFMRN